MILDYNLKNNNNITQSAACCHFVVLVLAWAMCLGNASVRNAPGQIAP